MMRMRDEEHRSADIPVRNDVGTNQQYGDFYNRTSFRRFGGQECPRSALTTQ